MNGAASKSSPALHTEHGMARMTQLFCLAWRADPQPLLGAVTPVQPGLLSGPLFQLVSCTALHSKSCFLPWNVKTQAKQLRVSALASIYPLQQGFAGGGMENCIMKMCLLQLEICARFPAWRGMGQCPSFCRQPHRGGGKAACICCQKWVC